MVYRAVPVTQRDGSPLANSNCRMASVATGIDHHSLGQITSTGAEMRSRQDDQTGGTDSGDSAQAWRTYGQDLYIGDGGTFNDALAMLREGRGVQLDVWHATARGPCLSGSGAYGHSMAVAPESSGTRWLVADPWCSPAKWVWWEEDLLRAGAEALGASAYSAAVSGSGGMPRTERELIARMVRALRDLFTRHTPDRPALIDPPMDVSGSGGRIFYTATRAQGAAPVKKGADDVAMTAAAGITSTVRADAPAGLDWFEDSDLTRIGGSFPKAATVVFVGNPIGEAPEGGSRAILVNTGNLYGDGSTRPSIVYVAADAVRTYSVPPPEPPSGDVEAALEQRDADWRNWLLEGSPGQGEG